MAKKLLVDFDGVIHSYTSGWIQHNVIPDPPVPGAFEFLAEAVRHFEVMIYSSRSKDTFGIQAMQKWFQDYGLDPGVLKHLQFPIEKPPAFLTIDDRAYCFRGKFPSAESLLGFRTWMERGGSDVGGLPAKSDFRFLAERAAHWYQEMKRSEEAMLAAGETSLAAGNAELASFLRMATVAFQKAGEEGPLNE